VSIAPGYKFTYDLMMTYGQDRCLCSVKKGITKTSMGDPFEVIKMRLANGDITEEEYKRLRKLLSD
jgi:uncharacterized membrane protein